MVQNGLKWSKMAQYGKFFSKTTKNGENGKIILNSVGQIFWYSNIFKYICANIFIRQIIRWIFLGQIYSDIHYDLLLLMNIFGSSFVQYIWSQIYSYIHSSKKKLHSSHTIISDEGEVQVWNFFVGKLNINGVNFGVTQFHTQFTHVFKHSGA